MSKDDSIAWAGLDAKTEKLVRALKSDLEKEYRAKIEDLEKKAAFASKVDEVSGFYDSQKASLLNGFILKRHCSDLDTKELGKLQTAFLNHFTFYNLFIQPYISNDDRGTYELWVIRGATSCHNPDETKIARHEVLEMLRFVEGFVECRKQFRKTSHQRRWRA